MNYLALLDLGVHSSRWFIKFLTLDLYPFYKLQRVAGEVESASTSKDSGAATPPEQSKRPLSKGNNPIFGYVYYF